MKSRHTAAAIFLLGLTATLPCPAAAKVEIGRSKTDKGFIIDPVPGPSRNDAATDAKFTLAGGQRDGNGADLTALHDGKVPGDADEPSRNFFFQAGTTAGRIVIDLGKPVQIKAVNTYSWHPRERAAQVFKLYAATGEEPKFNASPAADADPRSSGWQGVAKVDTKDKQPGGQHVSSVIDAHGGNLGSFRYLLLEFAPNEESNPQSQTFLSEIDVVDASGPVPEAVPAKIVKIYPTPDGKFKFTLDATIAPDLATWAEKELIPVVYEWYPKICALLPSDGYTAPADVTLEFRDDMGGTPAYAAGSKLSMSAPWFRTQLQGEAKGCVIHELTHVVQNYWVRPKAANPTRAPGWVTEGIPDYVRWFIYEPQSKGAEITKGNFGHSKFDDSYRTTANFLNWVVENRDKDFIRKLNAAGREGTYSDKLWQDATSKTPAELGDEWKAANAKRLGIESR